MSVNQKFFSFEEFNVIVIHSIVHELVSLLFSREKKSEEGKKEKEEGRKEKEKGYLQNYCEQFFSTNFQVLRKPISK